MEIRGYAIEQVTNLLARLAFDLRRALKKHDADSIHDLRLTSRRFGQALELFAPFLPEREGKKVKKRLRRLMARTGEFRNYDIVLALAAEEGLEAEHTAAKKLRDHRAEAAHNTTALLKRMVRRDFSSRWRNHLGLVEPQAPAEKSSQVTVADTARFALPLQAARFFQAGREAVKQPASAKSLHAFRLSTKSFRYSLELFRPVYGPALGKRLESLQRLQRLLGGIQDSSVAQEMLSAVGAPQAIVSRLEEREEKRRDEFIRFWTQVMDAPGAQGQWVVYLNQFAGRRRRGLAVARAHA